MPLRRIFAILAVYVVIVAAIVMIGSWCVPPLIAQAATLWVRAPGVLQRFQRVSDRAPPARRAASRSRRRCRTHRPVRRRTRSGRCSSRCGASSAASLASSRSLILSFYLLIEAESIFAFFMRFVPATRSGRRGRSRASGGDQGQRVAPRAAGARGRHGPVRGGRPRLLRRARTSTSWR